MRHSLPGMEEIGLMEETVVIAGDIPVYWEAPIRPQPFPTSQ